MYVAMEGSAAARIRGKGRGQNLYPREAAA
jgi:hypothetical protein